MKRPVLLMVLCSMAVSAAGAQERVTASLQPGEWVGGFALGNELVLARFRLEEGSAAKLTVLSMRGVAPATVADLAVQSGRIRFELPTASGKFAFDGALRGNSIKGTVERAGERTAFELIHVAVVEPMLYDQYAGAYELKPGAMIFVRRRDTTDPAPPSSIVRSWLHYMDEAGRQGMLYPASNETFFSGPSYAVPVPVELRIRFVRDAKSNVIGLMWRKGTSPEVFAARRKIYSEEDVRFNSGEMNLAGRLLVPATKGPHPAIVLIGSWRGKNVNGSPALTADFFAAHGIAAMVYDPPGIGGSTGDWRESGGLGGLADIALSAVQYLRRRSDMNPQQVGVSGVSWPAVVASLAASRSRDVAFIILTSAPGLSLGERYLGGGEAALRASGFSEEEAREAFAFKKIEVAYRSGEVEWQTLEAAIRSALDKKWFSSTWSAAPGATSKDDWSWREHRRSAVDDHPEAIMKKVTCPVLAISGESDNVVPAADNWPPLETGLRTAANHDYTFKLFARGDHGLWQVEKAGPDAAKGFVPVYLETMTEWLLKRVTVPR